MFKNWGKKSIVFFVASVLMEIFSLVYLAANYPDFNYLNISIILSLHFLAACTASVAVFYFKGRTQTMYLFVFIMVLVMPLVGYAGIFQVLNSRKNRKTFMLYDEYRQYITDGNDEIEISQKLKSSFDYLRKGLELSPIEDIIKDDLNFTEKLGIIRNLGRLTDQPAVSNLKYLLRDPNMDVRYYAGEQIARVAEQYNVFINELKRQHRETPEDPHINFELGTLLLEYAYSGLFDKSEIDEQLKDAYSYLEKSLRIDPDQFETNFIIGFVSYYKGECGKAVEHFNKALEAKENDVLTLFGIANCLWDRKRYREFHHYAVLLNENISNYRGNDKPIIIEFLENWGLSHAG